jgi:hypothetical protein
MARRPDARKRAEWRTRLDRFSRSGVTVARFCDGERVSVASFYRWRKVLGPVAVRRRGRRRGSALPGVFRQIEVASARPAVVPAGSAVAGAASAEVVAASRVSIHLPCGTRIEVDAEHVDAVRAVINELARVHRDLLTGIPSC